MHQTHDNPNEHLSVLATLRRLTPARRVGFADALQIAELQASRLLELLAIEDGPVPSEVITELPNIRTEYRDIPTSGLSYWNGQQWVICLNRSEPHTRQRFSLFHEHKHIIDHGHAEQLYASEQQAEQAADYFAGCALMPKRFLKRAWGDLIQRPSVLASLFDVSPRAMGVRLTQIGLAEPIDRCSPPSTFRRGDSPGRYHRQLSWHRFSTTEMETAI
jgi:Zn-dependent peptidase ImmA (M78 family)